jgi:hypothetical protein
MSTAGAAAALVAAPLAPSSSAASTPSPAIPAAAAQHLSTITERAAKMSGDARPATMEAVKTTRSKALGIATPGDIIPGSAGQTVYMVVMKGNFTLNYVSRPPKAHAPTGHYLTITFDPTTLQPMDLGLSNQAPTASSLQSLGPVSTLAP